MSLYLVIILFIILAVDFLVAFFSNLSGKIDGKEKTLRMLQRYGVIFGGYAAIAVIAYFCGKAYPNMEYIGGLLLDPIFRYSVSLLDRLKIVMTRPKREEKPEEKPVEKAAEKIEVKPEEKPAEKAAEKQKASVVTKAAPAKKPDPIMIEIEPATTIKTEKPKAKPRARKTTKA